MKRKAGRSPVLANAYLNPLDHGMPQSGFRMVRDADDFVILRRTVEELEVALALRHSGFELPSCLGISGFGLPGQGS